MAIAWYIKDQNQFLNRLFFDKFDNVIIMESWIAVQSKSFLAMLAILGCILFIFLFKPPYTRCDSQKEILSNNLEGLLFDNPKSKYQLKATGYSASLMLCRTSNSPGGCYRFFESIRKIIRELHLIPEECRQDISDLSEIQKSLWNGLELFVLLSSKGRWLEESDLLLFCETKEVAMQFYGKEKWQNFIKPWQDLPQDNPVQRVLSLPCRQM